VTDFAPTIQVNRIVDDLYGENCYILRRDGEGQCVIVDPGLEPHKIVERLEKHGIKPAAMVATHGHLDHVGGLELLKQRWPEAKIIIGADEANKLTDPMGNLSGVFGFPIVCPEADRLVREGDVITEAGITLRVIETPGHSAGHVAYILEDREPTHVFVGDVIFAGSIGRTDLAGGDYETLTGVIREKLFSLPDDTILLSGHGPATTVGQEKATNPYFVA